MIKPTTYYGKLRRRLSLILMGVALVPLFAISLSSSNFYQQSCLANTAAGLQRTVDNRKQVIAMFLDDQKTMISHLTRLYTFEELSRQEKLEEIFTVVAQSGIVDLGVIDASGRHAAYVGPYRQILEGKNYGDTEWFQEVMIKGCQLSDIFLGYREVPHIVVAVTDPLKKWILRATINSEVLNGLLRSAQVGEKGDAFIVNQQGEFQTPRRFGPQELKEEERKLLVYHEGTMVQEVDNNIYVTGWLKEGDWLLFVKMETNSVLDVFYHARNLDTMIIILASIAIIIAARIIVQNLVNKIETADRKKSELDSQMMQVEKMASLGRLAAGVAHEVNNPLQLIMDQAGWLKELLDEEDPEAMRHAREYRTAVEKITSHVKRASVVTHRLLGFSRKMETERDAVDVNTLIEEAISFLEKEANNNDIVIYRNYQKDLPPIITDGPKVQQVILNIINNSIDAVEKKGVINISTSLDVQKITISIEDTGPGFRPEIMDKIFDPFYTTKAPGKGTGLGLSISYNIIKQLGGSINVGNREGGGAIITIDIPAVTVGDEV
jgi:two-component system, NtrC family, sensor kinase